MDDISTCVKTLTNTGVDQSAYFRELKGIDFGKFCKQAKEQMAIDQANVTKKQGK